MKKPVFKSAIFHFDLGSVELAAAPKPLSPYATKVTISVGTKIRAFGIQGGRQVINKSFASKILIDYLNENAI